MISYLIVMYLVSLALGYVLRFTEATHALGKSLSDAPTGSGYQDAITPPRFSSLAIIVYLIAFFSNAYGWWQYGWLIGLGVTVGFYFVGSINRLLFLPKSNSDHFLKIITNSMISRHADYMRSGDELRASAMAQSGYALHSRLPHILWSADPPAAYVLDHL